MNDAKVTSNLRTRRFKPVVNGGHIHSMQEVGNPNGSGGWTAEYVLASDHDADIESITRQRDGWEQSAAQFCRGMEYYRGLLDRIGKALGPEAYIADDGSVMEDVLRAKLPELIERRLAVETSADAGVKCVHCNGKGTKLQVFDAELYDGWSPEDEPCETCNGAGRITTVEQYLKTLPANWHEDSSVQTWFPLLNEEVERLRAAEKSCHENHLGSALKATPQPTLTCLECGLILPGQHQPWCSKAENGRDES